MRKIYGWIITAALLVVTTQAVAGATQTTVDFSSWLSHFQTNSMVQTLKAGMKWRVGDKASYKMSIGGFINGTSTSTVREDNGTTIWMQQDMDLGFAGKQKIEVEFDKATGQPLKILMNGKEQEMPSAADLEPLEIKEDEVSVAAGTFKCVYMKIKNKKSNETSETWMNPQDVPMQGSIKSIADSPFGKVTQELTSFAFAP